LALNFNLYLKEESAPGYRGAFVQSGQALKFQLIRCTT